MSIHSEYYEDRIDTLKVLLGIGLSVICVLAAALVGILAGLSWGLVLAAMGSTGMITMGVVLMWPRIECWWAMRKIKQSKSLI